MGWWRGDLLYARNCADAMASVVCHASSSGSHAAKPYVDAVWLSPFFRSPIERLTGTARRTTATPIRWSARWSTWTVSWRRAVGSAKLGIPPVLPGLQRTEYFQSERTVVWSTVECALYGQLNSTERPLTHLKFSQLRLTATPFEGVVGQRIPGPRSH